MQLRTGTPYTISNSLTGFIPNIFVVLHDCKKRFIRPKIINSYGLSIKIHNRYDSVSIHFIKKTT
jgi:hypothetical protein